jgi:suppressor of ftsI
VVSPIARRAVYGVVISLLAAASGLAAQRPDSAAGQSMSGMAGMPGMDGTPVDSTEAPSGRMIVPMMKSPMIPGLEGIRPSVGLIVPGAGHGGRELPTATASTSVEVKDGDTLSVVAGLVRRTIAGRTLTMYAFNGQAPGPLIRARQGSTFFVRLRNELDRPMTIHWHGVRLDSQFDGSPGMTQPPIAPGATFVYAVHCPDAGVFWYHDHVREDIGQPMGLFGNLLVEPASSPATPAGRRALPLILSDLLVDGDSVVPFGGDAPNFALMGRFGNVLLINGQPKWQMDAAPGEVVRLLLTNAASARTFNVSFGDAPIKLIASDQGPYARETMVTSIVIAPGERYVADVRFDQPGTVAIVNEVQTIDHFLGEMYDDTDTLGHVAVTGRPAPADPSFAVLHDDSAVVRDIARFRPAFDKAPDEEIVLTTAIQGLPIPMMQFMSIDTLYRPPLEWADGMSDMNWLATGKEVRWVIRDTHSGAENMNLAWHFHKGDIIKIRVFNDPRSLHPMNHPLHLHGQRFLVIATDGHPNPYLVWKDTTIIPVGSTVDLLADLSNPGTWMLHCHISEHVESGMMAPITVSAN